MNLYKPRQDGFEFKKLPCSDLLVCEVFIEKDEYQICEDFSHQMWANKKTGIYGSGMINNPNDPRLVERTGMLGEMSLAKLLNLSVNITYIEGGDKHDFIINGKKADIKTNSTERINALLIKATKDNNINDRLPLGKDIYISAYVIEEKKLEKFAKLAIVGYINKSDITKNYLRPARRKEAGHWNWDIPYDDLTPIQQLKG